ncbi:hypothetical protein QR680_017423 [Steinernema hermaphroditum]|uniref:Ubiquitin carboxyl-terminal hydrolase n=1 Tax=Steinernema hermaphroditum TaxID=289476 RepID=A0AA39HEH1_9BILA|nr:hypothetical protein QR680_017423 [Steinernema hermaphroditum]
MEEVHGSRDNAVTSRDLDYLLAAYEDDGNDDAVVLPRGLTGLCNLGNTCYMNAALQALSNCPPFCNFFRNYLFEHLYVNEANRTRLPIATGLSELIRSMWSAEHKQFIAPNVLLSRIRQQCVQFRGWSQQDSQEFIRCFLDLLHNELRRPIYFEGCRQKSDSESESMSGSSDDSSGEEVFETADSGCSSDMDENSQCDNKSSGEINGNKLEEGVMPKVLSFTSLVEDVFNGELESSVKCLSCQTISRTTEKFQDLSLSIPSVEDLERLQGSASKEDSETASDVSFGSMMSMLAWLAVSPIQGVFSYLYNNFFSAAISLDDCLKAFFSPDHLRGDDMYSCEKCAKLRNGVKTCRITKLPEILCIHLKRFRHDYMYSTKVSSAVTFPICDLDLSDFLCDNVQTSAMTPTEYDLCAFVTHRGGGSEYGHYLAYCKNEFDNNWYEYDDSTVTRIDAAEVLNKQAYVLFYQKRSTHRGESVKEQLMEILRKECAQQGEYSVPIQWICKFFYFSTPGTLTNKSLLCMHGSLLPSSMKRHDMDLVNVSQDAWNFINKHYGNSSQTCATSLSECRICSNQWEHIQARKSRELRIMRLLNERNRIAGELDLQITYEDYLPLNCIPSHWWKSWVDFATNPQAEPPGPIDNKSLLVRVNSISEENAAAPMFTIRRGAKFETISRELYLYLQGIYGGGPEVFHTLKPQLSQDVVNAMLDAIHEKIDGEIERFLSEDQTDREIRISSQLLQMGINGSFETPSHS